MEIYRGKKRGTGEWIIGEVVFIDGRAFILTSPYLTPERPAYNGISIGCGLEDNGITDDGYEAAAYGWEEALERYEENFPIWVELEPYTVTRCTGKTDVNGNVLFEGDLIYNQNYAIFEICYGTYQAYCPAERNYVENVGFFVISSSMKDEEGRKIPMPLGSTENYAQLIGNIFDTKQLSQHADQDSGKDAVNLLTPGA